MVPYMLVLAGRPSLRCYYACMVLWVKGAFWRNCRQFLCKTSFSRFRVLLCGRNSSFWWRGAPVWHLSIGGARHPGPDTACLVGINRCSTTAKKSTSVSKTKSPCGSHPPTLKTSTARVRSEWARLRRKGLAIVWAPASQDISHVDHAGVGVGRLRSAPVSLPTFATAQFQRIFDHCRAVGVCCRWDVVGF